LSYTPLHSDFLTSTLLREGPDAVAVFMLVLASADKLGESSIQPSVAASLLRIKDERAEAAFAVLSAPDPKSRNKECEGRRIVPRDDGRWFIVSHQRYQHLSSRAAATQRQRKYEERKSEREQEARIQESTCEAQGCSMPVALAVAGRKVCSAHAFDPPSREPGEEG
jgi:hypothetical protein